MIQGVPRCMENKVIEDARDRVLMCVGPHVSSNITRKEKGCY
jgi:hypothetical protein